MDDLRPKPVPSPVAGQPVIPAENLPGFGKPPLQAGKTYMTDFTRKQMQAAGWQEGDPIPGDFGEKIQQLQAEIAADRQTAYTELTTGERAKNWVPPKVEQMRIEDLPEAQRAELYAYLQEYKKEVTTQQSQLSQFQEADAEIPESVQGDQRELMREQILQAKQARQTDIESVVIDDRVPGAVSPVSTPVSTPVSPPVSTPAVNTDIPESGSLAAPVTCPRCDWPTDKPFTLTVTDTDKQAFIAGVLGLSRFEKKYDLLGGNLEVYYRSLTTAETGVVQQQLSAMVRNGEILGNVEYLMHLMTFRLALSTSKIVAGGNCIYNNPPLAQWETEHPPTADDPVEPTALPRLLQYFNTQGPTQEPVRRIIGKQHENFQRLTEMLEAMMDDADFWEGIEQLV